jgi:hypothetical protein
MFYPFIDETQPTRSQLNNTPAIVLLGITHHHRLSVLPGKKPQTHKITTSPAHPPGNRSCQRAPPRRYGEQRRG